jgi:hypothetical protein
MIINIAIILVLIVVMSLVVDSPQMGDKKWKEYSLVMSRRFFLVG